MSKLQEAVVRADEAMNKASVVLDKGVKDNKTPSVPEKVVKKAKGGTDVQSLKLGLRDKDEQSN